MMSKVIEMNLDEPIKSDNPIDELDGREPDGGGQRAGTTCQETQKEERTPALSGEIGRGDWQQFSLQRLERLISLETELNNPDAETDEEHDWKARLVRKAIYCSFCDCIALDVKDEAREMLKETVKKA